MRRCSKCKIEKPMAEYRGHKRWCRKCRSKLRKDADPVKHIESYGFSRAEAEKILVLRKTKPCAICQRTPEENARFAIDHDHATGQFRDILCINCNSGLGMFKDDVGMLYSAIRYLTKHRHKVA
jgi:hypothetical protein